MHRECSTRSTPASSASHYQPPSRKVGILGEHATKRTPRLKIIRRVLGLTQEEFAARFQIPLATLRDWEQGVAEPDAIARAYLRAIAGDAAAVERALNAAPTSVFTEPLRGTPTIARPAEQPDKQFADTAAWQVQCRLPRPIERTARQ
jgi:DNA-binding transcriptional regulator YiaG